MAILHVENQEITRGSLEELLGVKDGLVDGTPYVSTGMFHGAEERLREGRVVALVLDLGLDPPWDDVHLPHALHRLAQGQQLDPVAQASFYAYRLAMLARQRKVPMAVLSNFPDTLELSPEQRETLRKALHAEKLFPKDEKGMSECAAWVRLQL